MKTHFDGRARHLVRQFHATVDHRDDAFKVAASEEVGFTAIAERFELRCDEERRRNEPDRQVWLELYVSGRRADGGIPAVREAEDGGVSRHDVEPNSVADSAAKRRFWRFVLHEAASLEVAAETQVLDAAGHLHDDIDVERRPNRRRRGIGEQ
jgi:hypothetical protein